MPDDCFNEAAGIHRRKRGRARKLVNRPGVYRASMRPPEFTGGNRWYTSVSIKPLSSFTALQ